MQLQCRRQLSYPGEELAAHAHVRAFHHVHVGVIEEIHAAALL